MNILHISHGLPPFRTGGLNHYCQDLMEQQYKQGNTVSLLFPGEYLTGKTRIKRVKHKIYNLYQIINPLPLSFAWGINDPSKYYKECDNVSCISSFFSENSFDIIHVHSLMGIHKEFLVNAKKRKIPIVFTTHDYFPFCIKCFLLDNNMKICYYHDSKKCYECNLAAGLATRTEHIMQSNLYKNLKYTFFFKAIRQFAKKYLYKKKSNNEYDLNYEKVKEYSKLYQYYREALDCITVFHCNSELSHQIYFKNYCKGTYQVIPISNSNVKIGNKKNHFRRNSNRPLKICYVGGNGKNKGLSILEAALHNLCNNNWELSLFGDDYIDHIMDNREIVKGRYEPKNLKIIFDSSDVLVVPSIWCETFGLVVIEALSMGLPVIVSNVVGSSMIVKEIDEYLIYDYNNPLALSRILDNFFDLVYYNNLSKKFMNIRLIQ